jgi:hypothetical protein
MSDNAVDRARSSATSETAHSAIAMLLQHETHVRWFSSAAGAGVSSSVRDDHLAHKWKIRAAQAQ